MTTTPCPFFLLLLAGRPSPPAAARTGSKKQERRAFPCQVQNQITLLLYMWLTMYHSGQSA
jgi:hypothetical protein